MRYITAQISILLLSMIVGCGTEAMEPGAEQTTPDDPSQPPPVNVPPPDPTAQPTCGNGSVDPGEECDGMDDVACPGACLNDCICDLFCGDGSRDEGEECDGGIGCADCSCDDNFEPTAPPSIGCQAICGNRIINPGEECEGGLGCTDCLCNVGFEPTAPPSINCQTTPPDETLLVRPIDGVVVLLDLTVWDTRPYLGESTAVTWIAGDLIDGLVHIGPGSFEETPHDGPGSPFALFNLRTREFAGADFLGIGSRAIVIALQEQASGDRLVSLDDGTTWEIAARDEAGSRAWQIGDAVVLYMPLGSAINLRTGRVTTLAP